MKKVIFIFVLTALWLLKFNTVAQNTFEQIIGTKNIDKSYRTFETENGNFIFVGTIYNDYSQPTETYGFITKINNKGEIIFEKDIKLDDTLIGLHDIRTNNNGGYYVSGAIGSIDNGYLDKLAFFEFDSEFNILEKYFYVIPENRKLPGGFIFKNSNNNFVIYGSMQTSLPSTYGVYPLLMEISELGELIREKYFVTTDVPSGAPIFDIIEKKDHSGYFALTRYFPDSGNKLRGRVLNLDNNFELLSYIYIPEGVHNVGTLRWFSDTSYILSGTKDHGIPNKSQNDIKSQNNDLALMVLDTLGNTINYKYIGKLDTTDFPGFFSNFVYSADSSSIFIVGTQNFVYYPFPSTKSEIILAKTDRDLNVIWEKFYGGDAYYIVQNITATSDGGFIIISSRYDSETQYLEDDIHILKLDSEGNYISTSIDDEPRGHFTELVVYPNPGSFELRIRTATQRIGGEFYLYDMSGKQVLNRQIKDINTSINTSVLRKGVYIYQYIYEDRLVENGKWVKQ